MYLQGYSPSTISAYLSAISFIDKLFYESNPRQPFVVRKLLEGIRRTCPPTSPSRLPVTLHILSRLLSVLPAILPSNFEVSLFKSMFLLAFFGLLRVGEITVTPGRPDHAIRVSSVQDHFPHYISFKIPSSKTDQLALGHHIHLSQFADRQLCPVHHLHAYLFMSHPSTYLFENFSHHPISRHRFVSVLKRALRALNIPIGPFNSHSFRIGGATFLHDLGYSNEQIAQAGRWKSQAYSLYVRT